MATLTSKLVVELLDRVTGPSRAVTAALGRLTAAQERNNARLNAVRGRMLEAGAVAYGLARAVAAPVRAATEFETKLEDIGQKINAPVSELPKLGAELRAVARETTQTAAAISEGMDVLAGMGASREDALGLLNPIGRAATAYNAEIADLSQAGYAALDNLKVPALEFSRALDAMAQAGKAGAFELKDMAKYFPQLGAGYQALGQKGVPAVADLSAALQIVRKGTGDSASAATNLSNILQKVNAPLTRKNFEKMGVDLEQEMAKAAKKGMSPIEAIAEITNRTLKGNLGRLGDLFNDAQVQQGLRPLIQNLDEYRRIRAEAMAAQGVVEEDYQRRLQTGALATQRWKIAMEGLNLSIGNALLPALTSLANDLIPIVNKMAEWTEAHPALTRAIVATTAGLVGLRVAAIAAQFFFLWMKGGVITAAVGGLRGIQAAALASSLAFLPLGRAMGMVAPSARTAARATAAQAAATLSQRQAAFQSALALQALASKGQVVGVSMAQATKGVREAGAAVVAAQSQMQVANAGLTATGASVGIVTRAFRVLKIAVIGTGIGAILVGIAAAGTWIYNNWTGISTAFEAFKGAFSRAIEPVMPAIQPVIDIFSGLWDRVSSLLGPIDELGGGWTRAGLAAGKFVGDVVVALVELPGKVAEYISQMIARLTAFAAEMIAAGKALMSALLEGIKAGGKAVIDYAANIGSRLKNAITSAAANAWSGAKNMVGLGSGESPAVAGARAAGGPVRAGLPYLVGERGPELVTFPQAGFVHDALKTARMMRNAALASAVALPAAAAPTMPNLPAPPSISMPDWPDLPKLADVGLPATSPTEQARHAPSISVASGAFPITIHAAPGQSPQEIAAAVERALSAKLNALSRGSFSDGA